MCSEPFGDSHALGAGLCGATCRRAVRHGIVCFVDQFVGFCPVRLGALPCRARALDISLTR